jgi:hypothetical protein
LQEITRPDDGIGASIFSDALAIDVMGIRYFWKQLKLSLEDGFKFVGIATRLTYFVRYAIQQTEAVPAYLHVQPH